MKNILLATIGASPQVLTETLYAIHQSGKSFPDEVYVITTQSAQQMLTNGLFRDGHLQALKQEYDLPDFAFSEEHIWLIEDEQGKPMTDAKGSDDQPLMADFITRKVAFLTSQPNTAVHASLAGGRKTMAFYFGYAMSLLGRAQDTLSHVFVDDNYEFVRDFWYPTRQEKWVTGKNGQGEVDLSKATVTLAEIPFVRMRHSVDPALLQSMNDFSFSQTVGMLNASYSEDLDVAIDLNSRKLSAVGVEIKLTAKELAFYLWIHRFGEEGLLVDRYFEQQLTYSESFLSIYSKLASDPRIFDSFGSTPEDFRDGDLSKLTGMDREFLQPICSMINRKLRNTLPVQIADKLTIASESEQGAQRYVLSTFRCENICIVVK